MEGTTMSNMPPPPPPPPGEPYTAQDAKARAKAEKAYRKASRPWYRKKRWWLLGVVVLLVIIIAATAGGGGSDNNPTTPGVDKGFGARDASADVTAIRLLPADSIGVRYAEIDVTNHSSKRSNYYLEFSVESPDGGTKYDDGNAVVSNLDAGQSTTKKVIVSFNKNIPDTAVVKVKTVSRTAS